MLVAGPVGWLPWAAWVHARMPAWWVMPVIASGLLLAAAACLPGRPSPGTAPEPAGPPLWPPLWPTRHHGATVALGLGLLLILEPLLHLAVLAYLAHAPAPGAADLLLPVSGSTTAGGMALRIAVLCLIVPMAEELFFRGRVLPLLATRIGPRGALTFTSLAFAVAHGSPISCLVALPLGLMLGWLRLRHRDLGACVLVHQAHNALFVLAGPGLVTAPLSTVVLAIGGALMLTLAALHTTHRWRAIPAGLALAATMAVLVPPLLALKDRWWAAGVARLAERSRIDPAHLVARLEQQWRHGRLTAERSANLVKRLGASGSEAARCARLLLEGGDARYPDLDDALSDLQAAARITEPPAGLRAAVLAIGRQWPRALAIVATEEPEAVAALLGPDGAGPAISSASGGDRKRLLSALEQAWPGRLASVLLALPPSEVTAQEHRHLRQHYPDADALVEALDPARRVAWRP